MISHNRFAVLDEDSHSSGKVFSPDISTTFNMDEDELDEWVAYWQAHPLPIPPREEKPKSPIVKQDINEDQTPVSWFVYSCGARDYDYDEEEDIDYSQYTYPDDPMPDEGNEILDYESELPFFEFEPFEDVPNELEVPYIRGTGILPEPKPNDSPVGESFPEALQMVTAPTAVQVIDYGFFEEIYTAHKEDDAVYYPHGDESFNLPDFIGLLPKKKQDILIARYGFKAKKARIMEAFSNKEASSTFRQTAIDYRLARNNFLLLDLLGREIPRPSSFSLRTFAKENIRMSIPVNLPSDFKAPEGPIGDLKPKG